MNADEILARLRSMANPKNVAGMARFGISTKGTLGISVAQLRKIAGPIRRELRREPEQAHALAQEWAHRDEEYVRRAGFALMAALALKRHTLPNEAYEPFFALIQRYATDERNFVKKALNWALRQIGKRNERLLARAIEVARELEAIDSRSARWVARDALRELLARC